MLLQTQRRPAQAGGPDRMFMRR